MKQSDFAGARGRFSSAILGLMGLAVAALAASPASAVIDPSHQFITNGGFEQLTNLSGQATSSLGELAYNVNAVGWTSARESGGDYGFNYVFNAATASTTGTAGQYGQEALWGPGNGSANGLTSSPTGGNFIGADGAYHLGKLSQALTGLIVGQTYTLTFNFAGAQEYGTDGAQTEGWNFGLNSLTQQTTANLANASHGFTGWQTQTYNFVATQASDTLYFLAKGTPSGQPPMSLLDSVSLTGAFVTSAPDPETWMLFIVGFGVIGCSLRLRGPAQARAAAV